MSSTTTVTAPGQTPQQTQLVQQQIELAEFNLTELQRQREQQEEFATELKPLFAAQAAEAERALARAEKLDPIQEELLTLALDDLRRGGKATPEQIELIDQATQSGIERGLIDVERFETMGLESLREELAPSLGLRPSDTPILDRGGRLAAEALRQRGGLTESFNLAGAQAKLNFPLAASTLLQTGTAAQGQLAEATRQFQENLRSQAFQNRLNLASTLGGLGLGLAGASSTNLPGAISALQPRGSTTSTSDPLGTGINLLGGVGGVLSGLGAVGKAGGFASILGSSSKEVKTDNVAVDDDAVLEGVIRLPVETWRYKDGIGLDPEKLHVGTYAEDFKNTFGLGDGKTLDMIDTTGVLMASVKALSSKIEKLERETFGLAA